MISAAGGVTGPVIQVQMCAHPGCRGYLGCPAIPGAPFAGLSDVLDRSVVNDEMIVRLFTQELALSACSDEAGIRRMIPPGSVFTVHAAPDPPGGGDLCAAVYSGPANSRDEWLDGSPEWTDGLMRERLRQMQAAA
jgi:hypothetical protein